MLVLPDRPLRFLWHYVRRRGGLFGGVFAAVTGAAVCAVLVQWSMKLLVDAMAAPDRHAAHVWSPLGLFLALIAMENILWRLGGWLGCRAVVGSGIDMRVDLFEHMSGHSLGYFHEHASGALANRVTETATGSAAIFSALIWNVMPPCTDFVGAIVVLATVDWRVAAALAAFVAVVAGAVMLLGVRSRPLHRDYAEQHARVNGEIVDLFGNIWAIKAFSARQRERERLERELQIEGLARRRSWMHLERTRVLHDLCLLLMAGSILGWVIQLWRGGGVTAGDVVVVSALTFRVLHGSRDLAIALVGMAQYFGSIGEALRVITRPHALTDPAHGAQLQSRSGRIDFEHIGYRYRDGSAVFEDFDLHIPAGQHVGLVGTSGAGKSTLLALLQRLDDVQQGRILIDGQPIADHTQDSLRAAIAVMPQDVALFQRSILENIRYGRPEASDEEVFEAARRAYCDGFIRELPQGYGTLVGERGVRLSGGQRQRLGIARAFLKNAPILVLDEATSALDTHSEAEIELALRQLARGRTVLAVAHRLSTVSAYERIVVLEAGRIVEDGAPDELRRRDGIFAAMWKLQAEGFAHARPLRRTGHG